MKLTAILLLAACLQITARTAGQTVTLKVNNVPMKEVFREIQKQTGLDVLVDNALLQKTGRVTLDVKDMPVPEVLNICLKNEPLSYTIVDGRIVVKPKQIVVFHAGITPDELATIELPIDVKGRVVNEKGESMEGITVYVRGTKNATATDANGVFELKKVDENATLVFSGVNVESYEVKINGKTEFAVNLKTKITTGEIITVVSTGYQAISKERATGSFDFVNNETLNRRISTNILDRLEGIASSILFPNKNIPGGANESSITVRGRSTIFANTRPLIVIDNFPYEGDINNINPNDIENITILKDAAAASIWGAFSGNGVIVITTKKAKFNQPLKVSVNSNITIGQNPDLFYDPNWLNSSSYIGVEKFLFSKGFYDADLNNTTTRPVVSPVVETLAKKRAGLITSSDSMSQISALINQDVRNDFKKYFYQKSIARQYALNLSGGSEKVFYLLSFGYDNNRNNLIGNKDDRYTVNSNNAFSPFKNIELTIGLNYTQRNIQNNNPGYTSVTPGGGKNLYTYAKLVDEQGNSLPILKSYRYPYIDTTGGGKLLDWKYRPLEEIMLTDNVTNLYDVRFNPAIKYTILSGLSVEVKYFYEKQIGKNQNYRNQQTFFARDLINRYTQISGSSIIRPIPLGGILDRTNTELTSQTVRGQVNFNRSFANKHTIAAIAGVEQKETIFQNNTSRFFGYNKDPLTIVSSMDFKGLYPIWQNLSSQSTIFPNISVNQTNDEYISYFGNAAYTYYNLYTLSGSLRLDQSNFFGVNTNQKGVPLWSLGGSWKISGEKFYPIKWLPYVNLRLTYGFNGNIDKTTLGITAIAYSPSLNLAGLPSAGLSGFPNPELRWEKIGMINIGLDFKTINGILSGSIEYYKRNSKDLIGNVMTAPSTGTTSFKANTAEMKGSGVDIQLTSRIIDKKFGWRTNLLFSYNTDKVEDYKGPAFTNFNLVQSAGGFTSSLLTPVIGYPLYSVFSFKSAGLDSDGNPQGYFNKQISKDYTSMVNSKDIHEIVYNGQARPKFFGGLLNTFSYKNFSLSLNISYKLSYYFRRNSINYGSLFNSWGGHKDFDMRWQKPGDEKNTNVPSMIYPNSISNRDNFYTYSEVLIEKGDHIRLQDLRFSYDLNKSIWGKLPLQNVQFYFYANNLGIIWKANKAGLDPDYVTGFPSPIPAPKTFAFGINANF